MKGGDLPRSWRKVSFTNSPRKWKIRLHVEDEDEQPPTHFDLPWHFDSEEEAALHIRRWKEADDDGEVIEEHKRYDDTDRD
jgi:hypothetical protein